MVKIKAGYIMTSSEKEAFDRDNARQRKTAGRVDYYYKPAGTYPARIYVFMHAEMWQARNRRPMGLAFSHSFLSRPMNKEEIEYHHFDIRMCYHQYEDWGRLIFAELQECDLLDLETNWEGQRFIRKLTKISKMANFPLKSNKNKLQ